MNIGSARGGLPRSSHRRHYTPTIKLYLCRQLELRRLKLLRQVEAAVLTLHALHGTREELVVMLLNSVQKLLRAAGASLWTIKNGGPHLVGADNWPDLLAFSDPEGTLAFANKNFRILTAPLIYPGFGENTILASAHFAGREKMHTKQLIMDSLAKHAAVALQRLDLEGFYKKHTASLELMRHVAARFAANLSLQDLFTSIYTEVQKVMVADVFFVALYDTTAQEVNLACIFEDGEQVSPVRFPLNDGPTSQVIKTNTPFFISLEGTSIPGALHFGNVQRSTASVMMAPIALQAQVLGVLSVQSYGHNSYTEDDLLLLSAIASQAAIAVHNTQLYENALMLATTDSLTGLMNKRAFLATLDAKVAQATANEGLFSLIMIDSDSLKIINDTYGHCAGDEHLCSLADILRAAVREEDLVCRYGGDEFMVLLSDTDADMATTIAKRIVERVRLSVHMVAGKAVHVTASAGVAEFPLHAVDRAHLLFAVDKATREAKELGKNRVSTREKW
ncbi:MAG: Phytochrome-like protein cph2 [Firmicutes bacterium]|nr:Phytochrome-like protein cph2 [Bacillota bacterium]